MLRVQNKAELAQDRLLPQHDLLLHPVVRLEGSDDVAAADGIFGVEGGNGGAELLLLQDVKHVHDVKDLAGLFFCFACQIQSCTRYNLQVESVSEEGDLRIRGLEAFSEEEAVEYRLGCGTTSLGDLKQGACTLDAQTALHAQQELFSRRNPFTLRRRF
jgi:hypothetical protein